MPRFSAATTDWAFAAIALTSVTSAFLSSRLSGITKTPGPEDHTRSRPSWLTSTFSTVTFTPEALARWLPRKSWSGSPSARAVIKSPNFLRSIGPPAVFDDGWRHVHASPHESQLKPACGSRSQRAVIDHHARTHGRADGDALQVHALRRGRLRLLQVVDQRLQVLLQRGRPRSSPCRSCNERCRPCRRDSAPDRPWHSSPRPATFGVTVPTFGFGIRPRGPRIWPS